MKFNIEMYDGKYVMHCSNQDDAKVFAAYLDSVGRTWRGGSRYLHRTNWSAYRENTCYFFNEDQYCDVNYALQKNYKILSFEDFDWNAKEDVSTLSPEMTFEEVFYGSDATKQKT